MIHYGDITKINGYDVPIVDCVVGGSPCQNFSVAGNREGLDGDQSVLIVEQLRVIKEMRDKDVRNGRSGEFIRPRFMVWENVPGAFSSNNAKDFQKVLEETAKIVDKDAVIPMPPKNKWSTSGAIVGDGWSIAWRVLDAQFWGVPQRRRRIALVADFGGGCAPEILFVRKSLRGDFEESRTERKGATTDAQGCIGVHDRDGKGFDGYNGEITGNISSTLGVNCGMSTGRNGVITLEPGIAQREGYPDGWTDIGEYIDSKGKKKQSSDSARYKALGNSIALPPWKWVIKRISAQYERDATLASLFDGIGGFPYLWEQINGKGSCLWASEIEDFPIAVTKARIE